MNATALIAEDEPVLALALSKMLQRLWPQLQLLPLAADGQAAIQTALQYLPDVLFLDIQMPDVNGLDAAESIMDGWPDDRALPLIVFVTAYDNHALAAFEQAAVDYVLKPVQTDRLRATCERLQQHLLWRQTGGAASEAPPPPPAPMPEGVDTPVEPLSIIQVATSTGLLIVPIEDVLCFEAADKYVRLITRQVGQAELLIRTPLRELLPRLDPQQFWQVHRSAVVNVKAIEQVNRVNGKLRLHIRGHQDTLEVSRMYAHRFKAM